MLSPQHHRSIRTTLSPLLGDEETDALLAELPSRPGDEPVTQDGFERGMGELRAEIADVRTEMRTELADVRAEMRTGFAEVRTEMHQGFGEIRVEMYKGFQRVYAWGTTALLGGLSIGMALAALIARGGG